MGRVGRWKQILYCQMEVMLCSAVFDTVVCINKETDSLSLWGSMTNTGQGGRSKGIQHLPNERGQNPQGVKCSFEILKQWQ